MAALLDELEDDSTTNSTRVDDSAAHWQASRVAKVSLRMVAAVCEWFRRK